ncbi:hypothetical protein [Pseudoroseomonas cervicalis]|uniref:hypothetical protein n=1 Tax=Teichococcus cervicalis TaxID=204525 RepID=UPI0022F1C739|nr:hypothetical protein [Pseudoroseomonas cervicalis]WBV42791.1 hypothetical protein PFY06_16405 [Pseudoroseomonas cervicalis]
MNNPRFSEARPAELGPHDVNEEQNDPHAKPRRPEQAYNQETGGQAAAVGPRQPGPGAKALTRPQEEGKG